ncbi:MAG: right-handed parallel beta-helix repeat-containing protein, partial [Thermoplasmata archaeon]
MKKKEFLSLYLVAVVVMMALPFNGIHDVVEHASASPDIIINGDWTVSGYDEYNNETIVVYGHLIVQNGGHLVLRNCTLQMMSEYLQPYDIAVQNGGIMEVYGCYITDPPDDDDLDVLSPYYYFYAEGGSTLIIENSTIRQCGFLDSVNPEHIGLHVGTNQGHISNCLINSTMTGFSFMGNNTGFRVDNVTFAQIGMSALHTLDSEGFVLNNIKFIDVEEKAVMNIQSSNNFYVENVTLTGEQLIYVQGSTDFAVKSIISNMS